MNSVLHIRLIDGNEIFALCYNEDNDKLFVEYPMQIVMKTVERSVAMQLTKFLPYTTEQYYEIPKSKIVSYSIATEDFVTYYHNSIHYNALYVDDNLTYNIREINKAMNNVLSIDNQRFIALADQYNVDISSINNQLPN